MSDDFPYLWTIPVPPKELEYNPLIQQRHLALWHIENPDPYKAIICEYDDTPYTYKSTQWQRLKNYIRYFIYSERGTII